MPEDARSTASRSRNGRQRPKSKIGHTLAELTEEQFNLIAELIRSREPPRTAAYMVLVEGKSNKQALAALAESGLSGQSLSNTLTRFRKTHQAIVVAYNID